MSGMRYYNYREGDRSEYLANYLLSGLGLVTGVPRQEDIGFDFYCQIADQELGNLSFGYPFIVQVKSESADRISYGNAEHDKWSPDNLNWLQRQEIPLLFGFINKKKMWIDLYNCSVLRFIFVENPNPTIIEFVPRSSIRKDKIDRPIKSEIVGWPSGKGDGFSYKVDLGDPIISFGNDDLFNKAKLRTIKGVLRNLVTMEQQNILFSKLHLPHFNWTLEVITNEGFHHAWYHNWSGNPTNVDRQISAMGPGLVSLGIHLRACGREDLVAGIIPLLRVIPKEFVPDELIARFPDLFTR